MPNLQHVTSIKADRPHPRNYPHMSTDYRHTDKPPRLVMVPIGLNPAEPAISCESVHRRTDGRTDRRKDATKYIFQSMNQLSVRAYLLHWGITIYMYCTKYLLEWERYQNQYCPIKSYGLPMWEATSTSWHVNILPHIIGILFLTMHAQRVVSSVHNFLISHWAVNLLIGWR